LAAVPFQQFRLGRKPLTRLAAGGPTPAAELEIRVNGELWREAASLHGSGPTARVYTVRTDDDGASTIGFGDGATGARLPSGAANIVAEYRTGLGSAGRVRSGQIATLLERPPGLAGVTNPLPADGGIDPEPLSAVRRAAPASVITFGRAVALTDHANVALETGLVARAQASRVWTGLEEAVHLSVLAPGGTRLSADGMARLHAAMDAVRVPNQPLLIGQVWFVPLRITARLLRDPAFRADDVDLAARTALVSLFGIDAWPLGRSVPLSAVSAALQAVAGVIAVDIDRFQIKGSDAWTAAERLRRGATAALVQPHVRLFDARPCPPAGALDPLAQASMALDPDSPVLPAELPQIAVPATDITFSIVDAL
jgi:predicted phage baseplate assembly protein